MLHRYYTTRQQARFLTLDEPCGRFDSLARLYLEKDYFQEKLSVDRSQVPRRFSKRGADAAIVEIGFNPFSQNWMDQTAEGQIFDAIEFLYRHVSKPGEQESRVTETGWQYWEVSGFDSENAQAEFRHSANVILTAYGPGYELNAVGQIEKLGSHGLEFILTTPLVPFDEEMGTQR